MDGGASHPSDHTCTSETEPGLQIHNPTQTRLLMNQIYDRQMSNIADYDCFSQVVFESVEHYKMMKEDPYYKEHLFGDHENFADTQRSQ